MRVGGLATGMDIESMVNKLMEAERMPLVRMEQDRTKLSWERDAFREINRALLGLEDMMFDMKLSPTYNSKSVRSSQENAVTATGSTSASNGTYQINVEKLATNAMNVGTKEVDLDQEVDVETGPIKFSTYDDKGKAVEHKVEVEKGDTIGDVLKKITNKDNNVRAFIDPQTKKVILETTRTGKYNTKTLKSGDELDFNGAEIGFAEDSFFTNVLHLDTKNESGGTDAVFTYNTDLELRSKNNSYELNGVTFQFHDTTVGNATLTVTNDVEHSFDSIIAFVDKYNEAIDKMNESQREERFRDFPPLTTEQKKEMSDDEIEKWEEKAQSGILRGESAISNGMFSMRQGWYSNVKTDGAYSSLTQIGITTSPNYMDGGKLIVDEEQLRNALRDNPNDVQMLFSNSAKDDSRGLVNRLEDAVKSTMGRIENRAGKGTDTLENYSLGKRLKDLNEQISSFEDRMVRVETRYWNQFTQMEKAIQRLNDQSALLFSQFGGGM